MDRRRFDRAWFTYEELYGPGDNIPGDLLGSAERVSSFFDSP